MKNRFKIVPSYTKMKEYPILDDKYFLIKKLGTGATSIVKLGRTISSGKLVAIKIMKNRGGMNSKIIEITYKNEIEALKCLNHKNIVNILDSNRGKLVKPNKSKEKLVDYLVLEYAHKGELFDYVYYIKKGFDERTAACLFNQILDGVEAIHKEGIVHRDLKTENILIDELWNIKIGDFGYAKSFFPGEKIHEFLGTISYAPPEILNRVPYDPIPADIFSLGAILFILVTGKFAFSRAIESDYTYKHIINSDFENFWKSIKPHIPDVSDNFKSLINFMLSADPFIRPSIIEIRNHPFMMNISNEDELISELKRRHKIVKSMKNREISSPEENEESDCIKFYDRNFDDNEIKIREFSDNHINPYLIRISHNCIVCVLSLITDYFKQFCSIKLNENSPKITVIKCLGWENLIFEVEVKKLHTINNFWILEFFLIEGNKQEFYELFEDFIKKFSAN